MKAIILRSSGRALCMIALICMLVAGSPIPHQGDDVLHLTNHGLEATLKIEPCGGNSLLTVQWKNTNAQTAFVILSLKSKSDQSVILAATVAIGANEVKSETCENIDATHRTVSFSDFSDVQADITRAN